MKIRLTPYKSTNVRKNIQKIRLTPYERANVRRNVEGKTYTLQSTNVRTNAAKITPYERTNLRENVGKRTCGTKKTAVLNVLNFTILAHFS